MKYVVGNWKMNLTKEESMHLASEICPTENIRTVLCPPYIHLDAVKSRLPEGVHLGAQNCSFHENGSYTGQISAEMILGIGCKYVILGHSEVRKNFNESDKDILAKAVLCQKKSLHTIICIGETLDEYEDGRADLVVTKQLQYYLDLDASKTIIAYEPVWAIGTGQVPEIYEIVQKLKLIKDLSSSKFPVLYGGSVSADNSYELTTVDNLDGFLIGSASLKAESFNKIASNFKSG